MRPPTGAWCLALAAIAQDDPRTPNAFLARGMPTACPLAGLLVSPAIAELGMSTSYGLCRLPLAEWSGAARTLDAAFRGALKAR